MEKLSIGSTPTITYNVPFDPTTLQKCRVVFSSKNGSILLEKNIDELQFATTQTGGTISFTMTQDETLRFPNNTEAKTQIHIVDAIGSAAVSNVISFNTSILLKREAL